MSKVLVTHKVSTLKPAARRRGHKYPFETLKVGDMFFLPNRRENTFSAFASRWGKRLNRRFSTTLTYCRRELGGEGVWQPCAHSDVGAVLGVAVRREA